MPAIPCIQTKVVWRCGDRLRRCGTLSGRAICSARCGAPSIYSFAAQCARIIAVPCATLWCRCPWVHESCWIYTHIHIYVYVYIHISCVLMCICIYPHIHSQAHVSRSVSKKKDEWTKNFMRLFSEGCIVPIFGGATHHSTPKKVSLGPERGPVSPSGRCRNACVVSRFLNSSVSLRHRKCFLRGKTRHAEKLGQEPCEPSFF